MNVHAGTIGGAVIATKTMPIPPMDFPIMMNFTFATPVTVTPGSSYVIELQQSPESVRWYIVTPGGGYAGGTAITDGSPDPGGDYLFATYGAGSNLTINVHVASIGTPVIGTASATVPVTPFTLFHVDFSAPITVAPGSMYVLELQQADASSMRWYIVDPGGGSAITDGTIDHNGDYIFQTYGVSVAAPTTLSINFAPPSLNLTSSPATGTISATLNPVVAGLPISIYYSTNPAGPWSLINMGPTDASGTYTVSWAPPATGTYYFRADFAGTSSYAPSTITSAPNSMIVVPEFPILLAPTMAVAVGIFLILNKRASKQQRVRCEN